MKQSPTSRTLQRLKAEGYTAQVVEKWNHHCKRRIDLFGVIDIVAITPCPCPGYPGCRSLLAIQATSGNTGGLHSDRRKKALAEPKLRLWLETGAYFQIWSWRKAVTRKKDGSKAAVKRWTLRTEAITLADLASSPPPAEAPEGQSAFDKEHDEHAR